MRVKLHVSLRKSTSEIEVKLFVFFAFFMNFLMKTLTKSIFTARLCLWTVYWRYICCEICMSGFSAFVLNLSKSGNILDQCQIQMEVVCSAQHHCHCWQEILLSPVLVHVDWWQLVSYMWIEHMPNICIEISWVYRKTQSDK